MVILDEAALILIRVNYKCENEQILTNFDTGIDGIHGYTLKLRGEDREEERIQVYP